MYLLDVVNHWIEFIYSVCFDQIKVFLVVICCKCQGKYCFGYGSNEMNEKHNISLQNYGKLQRIIKMQVTEILLVEIKWTERFNRNTTRSLQQIEIEANNNIK